MNLAMKTTKRVVVLPITALVSLAVHAQQVPTPADRAAAARANAEQDRQTQQQREAQQRDAAVRASAVRSEVPQVETYPSLPAEQPCFRIDRFVLEVPDSLPESARSQGASALPMNRFAFAREWLGHYAGQCFGKEGIETRASSSAYC